MGLLPTSRLALALRDSARLLGAEDDLLLASELDPSDEVDLAIVIDAALGVSHELGTLLSRLG